MFICIQAQVEDTSDAYYLKLHEKQEKIEKWIRNRDNKREAQKEAHNKLLVSMAKKKMKFTKNSDNNNKKNYSVVNSISRRLTDIKVVDVNDDLSGAVEFILDK